MKAGRPKGPEKVVFKKRVTPEMAAFLEKQYESWTDSGPLDGGGPPVAVPVDYGEVYNQRAISLPIPDQIPSNAKESALVGQPALNHPPSKEAHDAMHVMTEISELKYQIQQLLDENANLHDTQTAHEMELLKYQEMDLDEKGKLGWRRYYELRKQLVKKGQFDQEVI